MHNHALTITGKYLTKRRRRMQFLQLPDNLWGWVSVVLGVGHKLPQLYHTYRTQSAAGVSVVAFSFQTMTYATMVVHAHNITDTSTLVLAGVNLGLNIVWGVLLWRGTGTQSPRQRQ